MSASCRDCGNWNKLVNALGMSRMEHSCDKAAEVGQRIGIFGNDQPDIMNASSNSVMELRSISGPLETAPPGKSEARRYLPVGPAHRYLWKRPARYHERQDDCCLGQ